MTFKKILVTGANGFVGNVLTEDLLGRGYEVRAVVRHLASPVVVAADRLEWKAIGDIGPVTDWTSLLTDVDVVMHLAGRAHILNENTADPLAMFRATNTAGTAQLAKDAIRTGVKKFIFVSSIGVHGPQTSQPLNESSPINPSENYALSKWEAEEALRGLATSEFPVTIVRPPLVYGPSCPGNFRRLLKLASSGFPLPFKSIDNRRSFVGVGNLSDFLIACIENPAANNQTFVIADEEVLSLSKLIFVLREMAGRKAWLFPIPTKILSLSMSLLGKKNLFDKIYRDLEVDSSFARRTLNWKQPKSMVSQLRNVSEWYEFSKKQD